MRFANHTWEHPIGGWRRDKIWHGQRAKIIERRILGPFGQLNLGMRRTKSREKQGVREGKWGKKKKRSLINKKPKPINCESSDLLVEP